MNQFKKNDGQAILVLTMILGAGILGITTIAGFISVQKIRGATDVRDSVKAIYAADAGTDCALYELYVNYATSSEIGGKCNFTIGGSDVNVSYDSSANVIKSIGESGRVSRGFGLFLGNIEKAQQP